MRQYDNYQLLHEVLNVNEDLKSVAMTPVNWVAKKFSTSGAGASKAALKGLRGNIRKAMQTSIEKGTGPGSRRLKMAAHLQKHGGEYTAGGIAAGTAAIGYGGGKMRGRSQKRRRVR